MIEVKNKKVLVFGFGVLGGGLATTNWLLKSGANVTISDLKSEEELKSTLDQLDGTVKLNLGQQVQSEIDDVVA